MSRADELVRRQFCEEPCTCCGEPYAEGDGVRYDQAAQIIRELETERDVAREVIPEWVKPFISVSQAKHCNIPDCLTELCIAWRNLTPEQRRKLEEP